MRGRKLIDSSAVILCCDTVLLPAMLGMLAPLGEEEGEKGGGSWELLCGGQMETQMQSGGREKFLTCPSHFIILCFHTSLQIRLLDSLPPEVRGAALGAIPLVSASSRRKTAFLWELMKSSES